MKTKWIAEHFETIQFVVLIVAAYFGWTTLRSRQKETNFKVREADRNDLNRIKGPSALADAKLRDASKKQNTPQLNLPGIRLHGAPHEILGIAENANEAEIMKAYKDAIKLYHPDRIQGPAQEQIKFYQEASAQLNKAKEEMLQRFRKR